MLTRITGIKAPPGCAVKTGLAVRLALVLLIIAGVTVFAADEDSGSESYIKVRMESTLWETLVEKGVNPTSWRAVFEYNRRNNPAFRNIRSANRIPKGTIVLIPTEEEAADEKREERAAPSLPVVQDTIYRFGMPILLVRRGKGQSLMAVIQQLCVPASLEDARSKTNLALMVRNDLRDLYRRLGRELSSNDQAFYVPLHLLAGSLEELKKHIKSKINDPENYTDRESLLGAAEGDISHQAKKGETYESLARTYIPQARGFSPQYQFRRSITAHIAYMAQIIRHYNMNQPLWPGKSYLVPGCFADGGYGRENLEVDLAGQTRNELRYSNGLAVSLAYHVTRKRNYWRNRERYLIPMERTLGQGKPAYPDMIIWHRTGLEPEVEELLRSKGRESFSVRYIYRSAVTNYYIDELGRCFLIVDPEKNPRDHAGFHQDYRCFWNGQDRISDVAIGIEVEGGFTGNLHQAQLETAFKLQQMLRSKYIILGERILDHRKVACLRGPGLKLLRGRKADGLTTADRLALAIDPVIDPDVLRGLVDPNLDMLQQRQADSQDYWYRVELDPDLERSAEMIGWVKNGDLWSRPQAASAQ